MSTNFWNIKELDGRWDSVLSDFGIQVTNKPGQPCPACGGKDRFHYTNKYNNGTYICRQCTESGGTGLVLISKVKGWTRAETMKQLKERYHTQATKLPAATPPPVTDFERIDITDDTPEWDHSKFINRSKKYKFSHIWNWYDHEGKLFGHLARLPLKDDKKLVWQVLYGKSSKGTGWHQGAADNKPIVGIEQLLRDGVEQILLVEGEKTRAAAATIMPPTWAVMCIQGGTSHVNKTNLQPLIDSGLDVYLWPDRDANQAGQKHMKALPTKFKRTCFYVNVDAITNTTRDGWDLANALDEGWTYEDVMQWIDSAQDIDVSTALVTRQHLAQLTETAQGAEDLLLRQMRPLGIYQGRYVFYPKSTQYVTALAPAAVGNKTQLISLAGRDLLLACFPKTSSDGHAITINYEAASDYLMQACSAKGHYEPSSTRGIGAWRDNNDRDLIVNTGNKLYVNGVATAYEDYKTNNLYSSYGSEVIKLEQELTDHDINILKQALSIPKWTDSISGVLVLGWCVQAVLAPIFKWRSHLWMIGPQGSGKSYIQHNIIRPLLGKMCLGVDSETTAAGIRQKLGPNAFAVSFDEAEVRSKQDEFRMKPIMTLARVASSNSASVIKGSATGDSIEYRCQSCFLMSSIKPSIEFESDESRFTIIEVLRNRSETKEDDLKMLENLSSQITPDMSNRWIAHCMNNAHKLAEYQAGVKHELNKFDLSLRLIDQLAQLIACAMVVIKPEDIAEYMKRFQGLIDETRGIMNDIHEEQDVLARLINTNIRVPMNIGNKEVTILEAIKMTRNYTSSEFNPKDIYDFLCSYGIKIEPHNFRVIIANKSDKLQKILGFTNWNKQLQHIEGSEYLHNSTSFGSRVYRCRGLCIPLNLFYDEDEQYKALTGSSEATEIIEF